MKSRAAILFFGVLSLGGFGLFMLGARAQDAGQAELPSAPSASQQQSQSPAPAAPPPQQPAASKPSSEETPVPSDSAKPDASTSTKQPADDTGKNQPAKAGTSSNSTSPAGTILSDDESLTTIRSTVNEVNVVFTVTDRHGRYVKDLKRENFKVVDDNKPALDIRSFHAETNLPLEVGLLVDASNSVRDRFKFEQQAAIEFLNQSIRPRYDEAFVIGFDVTPEVTQDFTDDTERLAHGVHELRPGGGTALYDAIYFACRDKLLRASKATPVRRAIILLSDGDDNQSHVTREEAIEMAQRAEAIIYTISTNVSGTKGAGDKVLERIADATGGRAFFPFQIRDVANAFAEIQDELRSQYAVDYRPADLKHDGHYRTIEIVANDRKNLRVRSRRGWYAPSQ